MRRLLLLSALLHAGVAAAILRPAGPHARMPDEPARFEVIFGNNAAAPAPPHASAAAEPADGAGPRSPAVQTQVRLASADAGVRVERPDPSMIPALDDPGNHGPSYPPGAWLRHEQGTVLVRLHIAPDGTVAQVEMLVSSGYAALDREAGAALARWHFLPARQDGRPVASYRDQPVRFVIN